MILDTLIKHIMNYSLIKISLLGTLFVVSLSILLVYTFTLISSQEYSQFLFFLSLLLPIILTPIILLLVLRVSKHLKYFKNELALEVSKNKKKDLLMFEQARFVLMGEMLANISHQWKQPLNTIGLSIVSLRMNKDETTRENYFDIIEDNIHYLASTINDFMSFFDKKTALEISPLDIIVKEVQSISGIHMKNKGITFEIVVDESYASIEIASSISQVMLNLVHNSLDALEKSEGEKHIRLLLLANGNGLEIECCDNGKGIEAKNISKIFDPYFTTKEKQQGTGIGLHMSKEIIQKVFYGKINISSRQNSRSELHPFQTNDKTCFYIALPYSENCRIIEKKSKK